MRAKALFFGLLLAAFAGVAFGGGAQGPSCGGVAQGGGPTQGEIPSSSWSPLDLGDSLLAWYDPSEETAGTTASSVTDLSGNGLTLSTKAGGNPYPDYTAIDGLTFLDFTSGENAAIYTDNFSPAWDVDTNGLTVFAVVHPVAQGANEDTVFSCGVRGGDAYNLHRDLGGFQLDWQVTGSTVNGGAPVVGTTHVWTLRQSDAHNVLYIKRHDAFELNSITFDWSPADDVDCVWLGSRLDSFTGVRGLDGYLGEILFCRNLAEEDRTTVVNYLVSKWVE